MPKFNALLEIGKYHQLSILRETSVGLFLGTEDGDQENDVLLPNKYVPKEYGVGDVLNVFVYLDFDERRIATDIKPKILLHQFAFLKVVAVSQVGAFMDWGLEKDLMVPYKEQRQKMQEGRWYVVYMDIDLKTDRLFASNRLDRYLSNETLSVSEGDKVDIIITQKNELGYSAIVNQKHSGLIFESEVYKDLNVGQNVVAYVKKIRPDHKIDLSLQPIGFDQYNDANTKKLLSALEAGGGFLKLNDDSSPDDIGHLLQMSKKAFKKSLGSLYRDRKVRIVEGGIKLIRSKAG